ncbi:MAG: S41 family peptidase [Saprospiraceae bacterium]
MDQSNSKVLIWLPLIIGLCSSLGMYAGYKLQPPKTIGTENTQFVNSNYASKQKLEDVLSFLQSRYVDSLNMEESTDFLIQQLMYALDPYSEYLTKNELNNLHDELDGIYQGGGINFKIIQDQVYVESILPNGPASQYDIEPGDIVKEINGTVILSSNIYLDSISKYAQNNPEKLELKISKPNQEEEKLVSIPKSDILNKSIKTAFSLNDKSFYIKINRFSERTYKEFMQEVENYAFNKSYENLVIDLRNNSGGLLDAAADILNQLVNESDVLLFKTVNKTKQERKYMSTGKPFFHLQKIIVLINENSASASEILAGVLQDLGRATIIGTKSFGKATILELYPLSDGSSLELANSRIILPTGRCIQNSYNARSDSSLHWLSPFDADTIAVRKGSKSFPNGQGLFPDIEINLQLQESNEEIKNFCTDFILTHFQDLKTLQQKKNADLLISTYALKNWINVSKDKIIIKNKDLILQELKFQLTRILFGEAEEEQLHLKSDPLILKAEELLH